MEASDRDRLGLTAGNLKQKSRTVSGTKKTADEGLAGLVAEVRTGISIAATETLTALFDRSLEHIESDLSTTTIRGGRD